MAIEMRQVTDADELEQVYRFLYRVYVEQMGRVQKYADRARRRIEEPLDATARIFAGFDDDGHVVGTVRYGRIHRMVLVHDDIDHLEAVQSPFLPVVAELPTDLGSVAYYDAHHAWKHDGAARYSPDDELLTRNDRDLGRSPTSRLQRR